MNAVQIGGACPAWRTIMQSMAGRDITFRLCLTGPGEITSGEVDHIVSHLKLWRTGVRRREREMEMERIRGVGQPCDGCGGFDCGWSDCGEVRGAGA